MTDAPASPPPSAAPAPGAPRRRGWTRIALIVSICLNLLLIGAAAGLALRFGGGRDLDMPAGFDRMTLFRVFRALPDEDREAAHDALRSFRPKLRELAAARMQSRIAIAEALEAEPFSAEGLSEALNRAREVERDRRSIVDQAFVRFAASLPLDTRIEIAREMRERRPRHDWSEREERRRRD